MSLTGEEAARAIAGPTSVEADDLWDALLAEVEAEEERRAELLLILEQLFP